MAKTKNGVYYDLTETEYTSKLYGYTLYFSSKLHKEKYDNRLNEYTNEFNKRIFKRYGLNTKATILPAIALYTKIETRGFYITLGDIEYQSLNDFERLWE